MRFTAVLLLIAAIGPQAATVDQPTVTVQGRTYLQLQPEGSVLHVGQLAALSVASNRGFSVTSAGTALVLVKRERQKGNTIYLYRAVEAGSHTDSIQKTCSEHLRHDDLHEQAHRNPFRSDKQIGF